MRETVTVLAPEGDETFTLGKRGLVHVAFVARREARWKLWVNADLEPDL